MPLAALTATSDNEHYVKFDSKWLNLYLDANNSQKIGPIQVKRSDRASGKEYKGDTTEKSRLPVVTSATTRGMSAARCVPAAAGSCVLGRS
jgi:hypothetical protein